MAKHKMRQWLNIALFASDCILMNKPPGALFPPRMRYDDSNYKIINGDVRALAPKIECSDAINKSRKNKHQNKMHRYRTTKVSL